MAKNKAENVKKPKRIDIPDKAKAEVARITQNLDTYVAGVVAGMKIKGKWAFDIQTKQIVIMES